LNLAKFRTTKLKLNYELNKSNIEKWDKIKSKACKSL
jgi:ribosomal protein S17E